MDSKNFCPAIGYKSTSFAIIQEINDVEEIIAQLRVSYAPITKKDFLFRLELEIWRFDLSTFRWIDPLGTSDEFISI